MNSGYCPDRCRSCLSFQRGLPHEKCIVCSDLGLKEEILCDLNRSIQPEKNTIFSCHAFRPKLRVVGVAAKTLRRLPVLQPKKSYFDDVLKLMEAERQGDMLTHAKQVLGEDPDEIHMNIRFHVAWNVRERRPIFRQSDKYVSFLCDILPGCKDIAGGSVQLIWLAPDHLHLYLESDGNKPVDGIVTDLKNDLNKGLVDSFNELQKKEFDGMLWDAGYFAESIG